MTTTEMNPRIDLDLPARVRRRRAVLTSHGYRQLRTVIALIRLLEEACEDAADELEEGGPMARYLDDAEQTVRILRGLSTQVGLMASLIQSDMPAAG